LGIAALEFRKWIVKYDIESQVSELYGRMQRIRAEALYRNAAHFLVLEEGGYSVVADTWPESLGNGKIDSEDRVLVPFKQFAHPVNKGSTIKFDRRGLVPLNNARTICVLSDVDPDFDCIVVHLVRINMGKIRKQSAPCKAENCMVK
jgi:hypothetical protein